MKRNGEYPEDSFDFERDYEGREHRRFRRGSMGRLMVGKRLLAAFISAVMMFGSLPAHALAAAVDGMNTPPAPVTSTNDVYEYGGKLYKILTNGYIAAYVNMDDGSFSVLPAAVAFDPDKPASFASFKINGADYRYGAVDFDAVTSVTVPQIEDGVLSMDWKVGDFVISQIMAIREDENHADSYAVSLAYAAEYFGLGEAEVSARLAIDTLLGDGDDLPFVNGSTGEVYTNEALVVPAPEYLAIEDGDGAKAYLLSYELSDQVLYTGFPQAIGVTDFARLEATVYDYMPDETLSMSGVDSGAAVYFQMKRVLGWGFIPGEDDKAAQESGDATAIFKVNYGFTNLTYTGGGVSAVSGLMLLDVGSDPVAIQRTGGDELFKNPNSHPTTAFEGENVSFDLEPYFNDVYRFYDVKLMYIDPTDRDNFLFEDPIASSGYNYTFTIPNPVGVYFSGETKTVSVVFERETINGFLPIYVYNPATYDVSLSAQHVYPTYHDSITEGYVKVGEVVTVTLTDAMGSSSVTPRVEVECQDNDYNDIPATVSAEGNGSSYMYTFTVPVGTERVSVQVSDGFAHTIGAAVYPTPTGANKPYILLDAPIVNGMYRVNEGDTVTITTNVPVGTANAQIVIKDADIVTYDGHVTPGITRMTIPSTDFGTPPAMQFEYGAASSMYFDIEVRLETAAYHAVNYNVVKVVSGSANQTGDFSGYASVKLDPPFPGAGQTVKAYVTYYDGAQHVPNHNVTAETTDGASVTVSPSRYSGTDFDYPDFYTFTMPSADINITVPAYIPERPEASFGVYTKPFVHNGTVVAAPTNLTAAATVGSWTTQVAGFDRSMLAPAGAVVSFQVPLQSVLVSSGYSYVGGEATHGGVSIVKPNGEEVPFAGSSSGDNMNISFTMPADYVTIVVNAYKSPYGIKVKQKSVDSTGRIFSDIQGKPLADIGVTANAAGAQERKAGYGEQNAANPGDLVRIYLQAPQGYLPKYLQVKDGNGNTVTGVTYEGTDESGSVQKYTFTMPNSRVEAEAVYTPQIGLKINVAGANAVTVQNPKGESRSWDADIAFVTYGTAGGAKAPFYYLTAANEFTLTWKPGDVDYYIDTINPTAYVGSFPAEWLELVDSGAGYAKYRYVKGVFGTQTEKWSEPYTVKNMFLGDITMPATLIGYEDTPPAAPSVTFTVKSRAVANPVIEGVSYDVNLAKFGTFTLHGFNLGQFNIAPGSFAAKVDGVTLGNDKVTKRGGVVDFDMSGLGLTDGYHSFELSYQAPNGTRAAYSNRFNLIDANASAPAKTAKILAVVKTAANTYTVKTGLTESELADKIGVTEEIIISIATENGFQSTTVGTVDTWTITNIGGQASPISFGNGLSAGESASGLGAVTPSFTVTVDRAAANGSDAVVIKMEGYGMMAGSVPLFTPIMGLATELRMNIKNGEDYDVTMPTKELGGHNDTSSAPAFLIYNQHGGNAAIDLDLGDYGGFSAEYKGIKYLVKGTDISGKVSLTLPEAIADGPMAGIDIESLVLRVENDGIGFDGIIASGEFGLPKLMVFDASVGGKASINTFTNVYDFEVKVNIKVVDIEGILKLRPSYRFTEMNGGKPVVLPDEFFIAVGSDAVGIPLIPGTEVGTINRLGGGIKDLVSTFDIGMETAEGTRYLPTVKIIATGAFSLVKIFTFEARIELGVGNYRFEASGSVNLGAFSVPFFKELIVEMGVKDVPAKGQLTRMALYYHISITAALVGQYEFLVGGGSLEFDASFTHPIEMAKLAAQGDITGVSTFMNKLAFEASVAGRVFGVGQIPQFSVLGRDFGPYTVASAEASFYGSIAYIDQIRLTGLRVSALIEVPLVYARFDYDFLNNNYVGSWGLRGLMSANDTLLREAIDDGGVNGSGGVVIGEGVKLLADTSPVTAQQVRDAQAAALPLPGRGRGLGRAATPTPQVMINVSADKTTHTITLPDEQTYKIVASAPKDKLALYDPDGNPVEIRVMPTAGQMSGGSMPDTPTAAQAAAAYNAIEADDGKTLMITIGGTGLSGDWQIVSSGEPFNTSVLSAGVTPAKIKNLAIAADKGSVTFTADGLTIGTEYMYEVRAERKVSADAAAEQSIFLGKTDFTAAAESEAKTFTYNFAAADFYNNVPSGDYYPAVSLFTKDGLPVTVDDVSGVQNYKLEAQAVGDVGITSVNNKYNNATLGLLADLAARYGGNGSLNVTFTHTPNAAATALGEITYRIAVYNENGSHAIDDGGAPIIVDVPKNAMDAANKYNVAIGGLTAGHKYYAEVTPVFTAKVSYAQEALASRSQATSTDGAAMATALVTIPTAAPPTITLAATDGVIDQGTFYARSSGTPAFAIDAPGAAEITVKYQNGGDVIDTANATTLSVTLTPEMTGKYLEIRAKNAAGDTTVKTLYVTVLTLPPLMANVPASGQIASLANGRFSLTGTTIPNATVTSSNGLTAKAGANGSFTIAGTLSGNSEQLSLFVADKAGNIGMVSVDVVRGTDIYSVITFDPRGGTVSPATATTNADGRLSSLPTPTLSGQTFDGWYTMPDGQGLKATTSTVFVNDITLYAYWTTENTDNGGNKDGGTTQPPIEPDAPATAVNGDKTTVGGNSITTPKDKTPVKNPNGSYTLPGGGTITTPGGTVITVPPGTIISKDGSAIKLPNGGATGTVKQGSGSAVIEQGMTIIINDNKAVDGGYSVEWENPFADVKQGEWFYDAVKYVYTRGLMNGAGTTAFKPNEPLTRGLAVFALYKLANELGIEKSGAFKDVSAGAYYANAVEWAARYGIVSGYGNGNFGPDDSITREQLAILLMRYAKAMGLKLPVTREYKAFQDDADVADYAKEAIEAFFKAGIINGRGDDKFHPQEKATSAEVATMIVRFLEAVKKK